MIDVENVTVVYDDVTAIDSIDLRIDEGEFVTVIGPSGCGKTTLLRAVGGLRETTTGEISLDGEPPAVAQTEGNIGFVFQQHTLLPWKSALDNVTFLRQIAGKPVREEAARELLSDMGLSGFEDARPAALSGGMAQRVAIARAVHLDSDVLLMDEPFGELDEITREEMGVELRSVWRTQQKTVLFVTHSVPEAVLLADRCVLMRGMGQVTHVFDIDLPRPRDESVMETEAFQRQVAAVRRTLHENGGRHEHENNRQREHEDWDTQV